MALINFQQREIIVKVVYYGPAFSGKTTNLRALHGLVPAIQAGDLTILDTEEERTLFFDYFPLKAGAVGRYRLKLQIYSVPGQPHYRNTRRLLLQNVDGVIFVADSQPGCLEANEASLTDLCQYLEGYGVTLDTFPAVVQYNKRDLPDALPVETLDARLNERGWPYCEATAIDGIGVREAFDGLLEAVVTRLRIELTRVEQGIPVDGLSLQPGGTETEDDAALGEMVTRIASLHEHGAAELRQALSRLEEGPELPLELTNVGPVLPRTTGELPTLAAKTPSGGARATAPALATAPSVGGSGGTPGGNRQMEWTLISQAPGPGRGEVVLTLKAASGATVTVRVSQEQLDLLIVPRVPVPAPVTPAPPEEVDVRFPQWMIVWLSLVTATVLALLYHHFFIRY